MRRFLLLTSALALTAIAIAISQNEALADGLNRVFVTNLPDTQQIRGAVTVPRPIPHTAFSIHRAQASPGAEANPNSYTDGGIIETAGFTSASLALSGYVEGQLTASGSIGLLLVPEIPEILESLQSYGIPQFAIRVDALVQPSESGIFHSEQIHSRLGFPKYRVFFYNTTPRSSRINLYVYLSN